MTVSFGSVSDLRYYESGTAAFGESVDVAMKKGFLIGVNVI